MKVKELIEKLRWCDQEMLVVTRGFDETGYAHIEGLDIVIVKERSSEFNKGIFGDYEAGLDVDPLAVRAVLVDHL